MEYKDLNAIGIVRLMLTDGVITEGQAAKYFPELAEVKDEDIKRWVINEIKIKHHALDEENVDFVDKAIAWLEKQGTKNTAWTEYDECCKNQLVIFCERFWERNQKSNAQKYAKWLENLKGRVVSEANYTTAKEWSDEDEKFLSNIIKDLVRPWNEEIPERIEDEIEWLKNKLRTKKSRRKWKPSKEQMEALEEASNEHWEPDGLDPLYTLLQDLKKLMEE